MIIIIEIIQIISESSKFPSDHTNTHISTENI